METIKINILLIISSYYFYYCYLEGKREAFQDFYKMQTKYYNTDKGEHKVFTLHRAFVHGLMTPSVILSCNIWYEGLIMVAGLILTFMFIHDNSYYYNRNELKEGTYPKADFLSWQTKRSNSILDQKKLTVPYIRDILFGIGIILVATIIMVQLNKF